MRRRGTTTFTLAIAAAPGPRPAPAHRPAPRRALPGPTRPCAPPARRARPPRRRRRGRRSARPRRAGKRPAPDSAGISTGRRGLLQDGAAQQGRLLLRVDGERAARRAAAQVPVEERRLEGGEHPVQPERNRLAGTFTTCRCHTRFDAAEAKELVNKVNCSKTPDAQDRSGRRRHQPQTQREQEHRDLRRVGALVARRAANPAGAEDRHRLARSGSRPAGARARPRRSTRRAARTPAT